MPSQPNRLLIPSFPSSTPRPLPLGGRATPKALRPREWAGLSNDEILSRFVPGKASPHTVLEVLLKLHNMEHTARAKSVSFKTRYERANFLRHFFRELESRGGFKKAPDPRNLGQRHIQAAVDLWRKDGLKPSTIQTYLSFLRGLASWLSKPGFIRPPAYYGLELAEYQRSGINERDKSWSAQGVDVDDLIDKVAAFDPYVGGMLRLIRAFGLRKREAIMFRPNECVVNFADTGLPLAEKQGEEYVWIRQGAKGGRPRFVPMNTPRRRQAVASTQRIAFWDSHAHTGDPDRDLKQNMVRFGYVLRKFGITSKGLGITAHGLRHEALIEEYIAITGQEPPLRGGGEGLTREQEDAARLAVSRLAGHNRGRASAAYLGAVLHKKKGGAKGDDSAAGGDPVA